VSHSSLVLLSTNKVYDLINYTTYIYVISMACSFVSLIYLRIKKPHLPRPLRLPLVVPIVFCLVLLLLLAFPIYLTPWDTAFCFGFMASGVPVYAILVWRERKIVWICRLEVTLTRLVQKAFLALPEDKLGEELKVGQ
jgi:amino acid transporter